MSLQDVHIPVMRREVIEHLKLKKGDIIFDGTLGGAGHTVEIIKAIAPTGKLIGVDLDSQAISTATRKLKEEGLLENAIIVNDNFKNVLKILDDLNIEKVNGFLLDLGLSSIQIEDPSRGFSYMRNEEIDMRFKTSEGIDASFILNSYSEEKLKDIFYRFGEDRWSAKVAKRIVEYRKENPIRYTGQLVDIVEKAIPVKYRYQIKGHPAKRFFQALRIEVNRELDNLEQAIKDGIEVLKRGSRMVIISYHSLEDRIVKKNFELYSGKCICPPDFPICDCKNEKKGTIITKKILRPEEKELNRNPRSASAKLRVFEKI